MGFLDTEKFVEAVNDDPEFRIAGRFWDATIKLVVGDEIAIIKIRDGQVKDVFEPAGRNYMIQVHEYDVFVSAPAAEWAQFFVDEPKPFYHDLFAAVTRHDFDWGGDVRLWFAYYGALRQMFWIMRRFVTLKQEV
jgi:hypothetical protein